MRVAWADLIDAVPAGDPCSKILAMLRQVCYTADETGLVIALYPPKCPHLNEAPSASNARTSPGPQPVA